MSDLKVQSLMLPGIDWRYTLPADEGRQVVVVTEDPGPRQLVFVDVRLGSRSRLSGLPDTGPTTAPQA